MCDTPADSSQHVDNSSIKTVFKNKPENDTPPSQYQLASTESAISTKTTKETATAAASIGGIITTINNNMTGANYLALEELKGLQIKDTICAGHSTKFSTDIAYQWSASVTCNFLPLYYRNERFNLQCFPGCKEHGDYAIWKREGRKHKERTSCAFSVSAVIRTPSADIADGDILTLGHITRIDDNPYSYLKTDQTYEYDYVQSLEYEGSGRQPTLIRGINPILEDRGTDVQKIDGQLLEVNFFPQQHSWFQHQSLTRSKKIKNKQPTYDKFVFEMFVFVLLPAVYQSYGHTSKLEYKLVSKQWSSMFEIKSTRTLKRELKASIATECTNTNCMKRKKIEIDQRKEVRPLSIDVNSNAKKKKLVSAFVVEESASTFSDNFFDTRTGSYDTMNGGAGGDQQNSNSYTQYSVVDIEEAGNNGNMDKDKWRPLCSFCNARSLCALEQ